MVRQGDILFIDLNPTKGNEMAKKDCVWWLVMIIITRVSIPS